MTSLIPYSNKRSLDDDSQLYIILKELHWKTYKCLAESKGDKLMFANLEALRFAKVPYFADLNPTDEDRIVQRGELLPLEIDYTPSIECAWHRFLEKKGRLEEDPTVTDKMDVDDKVQTPELRMDECDESNEEDESDEGVESDEEDGGYESDEASHMPMD